MREGYCIAVLLLDCRCGVPGKKQLRRLMILLSFELSCSSTEIFISASVS